MAKTSCKKGQYYCNTDKKCKPIPDGYKVREDGFLVSEGSNPRIPRKAGQPAKSKKHSDLYTDEDPKGTIHGLGFKNVATAKASVAKIRKSSRSHAHKIQAAIAMEQRARVMGKSAEAAVYRKFINSMKKKTKRMNEEKHGDHEPEMIRSQLKTASRASKRIEKHSRKKENFKAWVQSKITKASDYLDTAADYLDSKDVKEAANAAQQAAIAIDMKKKGKKPKSMSEGSLHKWFKGSKSKDGKGGWVNVVTGGTCASDEPGEGTPKCVSSAKRASMSKKERLSAARRKKKADPNQQQKRGAAKPTYVSTDKPKKKKKMKEEFISLPLQLEVPQSDGEFKLGLMFRESLEQDRGMLFIFENTDRHSFHMKNTFIPLDIAFINEEGVIESIKELEPMSSVPVYPEGKIRYAVEVNRGWFAENGIEVGDIILEDTEETEIDLNEVKDKKGKGSGTKDACYHKVKSRYSVWPSAYASGALVKCRKVGAANWGNSSKKEEVEYADGLTEGKAKLVKTAAKAVSKLVKQGVRKAGQAGGSIKPKKGFYNVKSGPNTQATIVPTKDGGFDFKMARPASGGSRRVKASYGKPREKSLLKSMRDKLEAQKKGISVQTLDYKKGLDAKLKAIDDKAVAKQLEKQKKAGEKAYQDFLNKPANIDPTKGKITGKSRSITNVDDTKGMTPSTTGKVDPTISRGRRKRVRTNPEIDEHYNWRETLDEKCWKGYEKKGMKTMFGKRYPNCVKKTKKEELQVEVPSLDEKVKTKKTEKNPANMALPKGVKSPVDYRGLYSSNEMEGELTEKTMTSAQKRKDTMLKKKYDDSDMKKNMIAQYGKEEGTKIYFAKIRKEAMKEDTAIENELVIQDWNVDDINYTEVEAVDIIKPEPLKPSPSNWREDLGEDWQKVNRKDKTDGMSKAAVKAYRRENPGSKLKTAVTKDPKKLKKGSKSAKRRLAFCRRMKGMKKKLTSAKTRRDPDSRINKALRRWNC